MNLPVVVLATILWLCVLSLVDSFSEICISIWIRHKRRVAARRAQEAAMPVIGFLSSRSPDERAHLLAAFHRGLDENGYVERQNITIESRTANGNPDRLLAAAQALLRARRTGIRDGDQATP